MTKELASFLESSELFKGFSEEQLQSLVTNLDPKEIALKNRDFVYKRGEIADRCWLIKAGNLLVERPSLRHPYRDVNYKVSEVTGLQGIVAPGSQRPVNLLADGEVQLIEILNAGVLRLDAEDRVLLYQNINRILLDKLFNCRTSLSNWEDYRM